MRESFETRLPELVRMRASADGERGRHWMASLDDLVAALERKWSIATGEVFAGGSESLVVAATLPDRSPAILKLGLPGTSDLATEATVLRLADGRGYATFLDHDAGSNALLLERLGGRLSAAAKSPGTQFEVICDTLTQAWLPLDDSHGLMTGAEKCVWLRDYIDSEWRRQGEPCAGGAIERAIGFARERETAHAACAHVLVHGDAHADNLLASHDEGYRFVDPDGLFAEKAADLASPMREGNDDLLAGDVVARACARCEWLASRTAVDARAIWQWGFVERVSTGLALLSIGVADEGAATLAIAERLADIHAFD